MSKLAHYLQQHILGEVLDGADVRSHFSRDASVVEIEPAVVVYPKNEQDVRKVMSFVNQLADRGKQLGVTARGAGSDLSGASVGEGVILAMAAHMNRVVDFDPKSDTYKVESGINISKLQQMLHVNFQMLPSAPLSAEYATIGGAVANNSGGVYSEKYGSTREYIHSMRVVLSSGEVMVVKRLSSRELNKKLGLANFEGQIYREIDTMLTDNAELLREHPMHSNAGYALEYIRDSKGGFSLIPLFAGAQGTLGIVTEVEMTSAEYNPFPTTILAEFETMEACITAVTELKELDPAALEMVDGSALRQISRVSPLSLKGTFKKQPNFALIVEFDDNKRKIKAQLKKAGKILDETAASWDSAEEETDRDGFWKVRNAVGHIIGDSSSKGRALPGVENVSVPLVNFAPFYTEAEALFRKHRVPFMSWGHIGQGQLSVMPKLDLSEISGRQRLVKIMDEYTKLVLKHSGSTSGFHNDGRLSGQYLEFELGKDLYNMHVAIKQLLDPKNVLNPGVKIGVDRKKTLNSFVASYSLAHRYSHLPRL
ncbi:MAG: FAD-binding oxidoreductase [Patescibacteria group bacterium]